MWFTFCIILCWYCMFIWIEIKVNISINPVKYWPNTIKLNYCTYICATLKTDHAFSTPLIFTLTWPPKVWSNICLYQHKTNVFLGIGTRRTWNLLIFLYFILTIYSYLQWIFRMYTKKTFWRPATYEVGTNPFDSHILFQNIELEYREVHVWRSQDNVPLKRSRADP